MKEEIRQLILKALLTFDTAIAEIVLRNAVRKGLAAVITEMDLTIQIQWCEAQGYIIGTSSGLVGTTWMLTTEGKLHAAQLK